MAQKWKAFCPKFHLPMALPTTETASSSTPYSNIRGFIKIVAMVTPNIVRKMPLTTFPQMKHGAKEKTVTQRTSDSTGSVKPKRRTSVGVRLCRAGLRSFSTAIGMAPLITCLTSHLMPWPWAMWVNSALEAQAVSSEMKRPAPTQSHSRAINCSFVRPSQCTRMASPFEAVPCTASAMAMALRNISRRALGGTRYLPTYLNRKSSPSSGSPMTNPW
mmetsp:Transcript_51445/g.132743  ORF Transcript_51445/g.132743 Transcript_51445/m.132743 type:complete len:217 (-) Transcript_51445:705-1355(-)